MKNYVNWLNENSRNKYLEQKEKILTELEAEAEDSAFHSGEKSKDYALDVHMEDSDKTAFNKITQCYDALTAEFDIPLANIYEFIKDEDEFNNSEDNNSNLFKKKHNFFYYVFGTILDNLKEVKIIFNDDKIAKDTIYECYSIFNNVKVKICCWKRSTWSEAYYFISDEDIIKCVLSLDKSDKLKSMPISIINSLISCDVLSKQSLDIVNGKIKSPLFNI